MLKPLKIKRTVKVFVQTSAAHLSFLSLDSCESEAESKVREFQRREWRKGVLSLKSFDRWCWDFPSRHGGTQFTDRAAPFASFDINHAIWESILVHTHFQLLRNIVFLSSHYCKPKSVVLRRRSKSKTIDLQAKMRQFGEDVANHETAIKAIKKYNRNYGNCQLKHGFPQSAH